MKKNEFITNKVYVGITMKLTINIKVLLIVVGASFGQFSYFWEIEKKILIKMKLIKSTRS